MKAVARGRYSSDDTSPVRSSAKNKPDEETMSDDGNNNTKLEEENNGKGTNKSRPRNPIAAMKRRLGRNKSGGEEDNNNLKEEDALAYSSNDGGSGGNIIPENTAFRSAIVLTQAGADIGMAAAEAEAETNGWDVTICICDPAGVPIQVKRNISIGAASYNMAVNKAKAAALFGKTTGSKTQSEADALTTEYPFLQIKGGVPLNINGTCCGAVGVSGMCEPEQNEKVAQAAAQAMTDIYWSFQVLASETGGATSPAL